MKLSKEDLIKAGIRFIGVAGPSGAGKTTAVNIMHAYYPHAIVLPGDYYMAKAPVVDKELAMRIFGRTFNSLKEFFEYFNQNETAALVKKLFDMTRPYVTEMYLRDISNLLKQNHVPNPIIADYVYLNAMPEIWDLVTDKIKISSPFERIQKNITAREGGIDRSKTRHEYGIELYDLGGGTTIYNNGTLAEFEESILNICKTFIDVPSKIF